MNYIMFIKIQIYIFYGIDPNTQITGTAHTSFITNNSNVRTILQLEDAYIKKNIKKTKIHAMLSERTGGILAEIASNIRIDISIYFLKRSLGRDYYYKNEKFYTN